MGWTLRTLGGSLTFEEGVGSVGIGHLGEVEKGRKG